MIEYNFKSLVDGISCTDSVTHTALSSFVLLALQRQISCIGSNCLSPESPGQSRICSLCPGVIGYSTPPIFGIPLQNILGYVASPCQISLGYMASLNTPLRKFCTPTKIACALKLNCSKTRLTNSRTSYRL